MKWLMINNLLKKVISVASFAILARILEPSVFGLFAMAFIVIDGFSHFKSFGVDMGLIQRKDRIEEAKHTAFWMTLGIGVTVFFIFQLVAPIASKLLNSQEVLTITRALGFVFIFGCLGRIPGAMLQREMRFGLISAIELTGSIINCIAAVSFALISPTVWSLVWAYLIKQMTIASLNWYFERYRAQFVFDKQIAKELFHFGKYMVAMGLLGFFVGNTDTLVIARLLDPTQLGFYILAINITFFTHHQFIQHIGTVLFPAYAKVQNDSEAIKRGYLKTNRFIAMITIPFGFVLILLSKEIVLFVYGDKWLSIVPLIQVLAIHNFLTPITGCSGAVFMGTGRPKYVYWLQVIALAIKIPAAFILVKAYGLMGAVVAGLIESAVTLPINYYLVRNIVRFTIRETIEQILPALTCCLAMAGIIVALKLGISNDDFLTNFTFKHRQILPLPIFGLGAIAAYFGALFVVDRNSFQEVKKLLFRFERP